MEKKHKETAGKTEWVELAWMGWQVSVPADWRPLRIEGEWLRGTMVIGNSDGPCIQVKWIRPDTRRFRPDRAIARRTKKEKRNNLSLSKSCPSATDFRHCSWLTGKEGTARAVWYGYAPKAELMLELVARMKDGKTGKWIEKRIIPSLKAFRANEAMPIAVFGASFKIPAGFTLKTWKLELGDITIKLDAKESKSLTLRQVYPAGLALSRRPIERWQELKPFKEHRSFRTNGKPAPCRIERNGHACSGIRRCGKKRLPVPLGMIASRTSVAMAVHDVEDDRIFMAEYDAKKEAPEGIVARAIAEMNWAMRNGQN